jgi:hypothetical protein
MNAYALPAVLLAVFAGCGGATTEPAPLVDAGAEAGWCVDPEAIAGHDSGIWERRYAPPTPCEVGELRWCCYGRQSECDADGGCR